MVLEAFTGGFLQLLVMKACGCSNNALSTGSFPAAMSFIIKRHFVVNRCVSARGASGT